MRNHKRIILEINDQSNAHRLILVRFFNLILGLISLYCKFIYMWKIVELINNHQLSFIFGTIQHTANFF